MAIIIIDGLSETDNVSSARELSENVAKTFIEETGCPDEEDKEIRVNSIENESAERAKKIMNFGGSIVKRTITIAYTESDSEYGYIDENNSAFRPSQSEGKLEQVGRKILANAQGSNLGISEVVFQPWENTNYLMRKEIIEEPILPVSEQEVKEIMENVENPKFKMVVLSDKRNEKELTEKIINDISKKLDNLIGKKVEIKVEFSDAVDTDFSFEFDCDITKENAIPEIIRAYMSELVLSTLEKYSTIDESSAEVWIRQGKPKNQITIQ